MARRRVASGGQGARALLAALALLTAAGCEVSGVVLEAGPAGGGGGAAGVAGTSGSSGQSGAAGASGAAGTGGASGGGGTAGAGGSGVRVDVLAAGPYHTCAVDGGKLWCWGRNTLGQLGTGDTTDRSAPTPVTGADWEEIVIGERHTCARRAGGSVWCWGDGALGELGTGSTTPSPTPAFVSLPDAITSLGSTYNHTGAITRSGELYAWGANAEGQLAQGDPFPGVGVDRPTPVRVGADADWTRMDAGQGHSCGLRAPGRLWCWGRNSSGELGIGSVDPGQIRTPLPVGEASDWTDVRAGQTNTCGLRAPGALYCWGTNGNGLLGGPDVTDRAAPLRIGDADDWVSLSLDTFHACGLRQGGRLYCWGRNVEGQLGLGDTTDRTAPTAVDGATDWAAVAAGRFHTCALKLDGSVHCTGQNSEGQLGLGDLAARTLLAPVTFGP